MKTIVTFLIVFSIIVVIHEFGHFYFARRAGILVREFAIGMGPKLFSKLGKDGVLYTVRMLPLGGYVRLAGLGEDSEAVEPGMTVGLVFDESDQVVLVNTSQTPQPDELPVRVDQVDLTYDMTIQAIPINEEAPVTYQVAKKARVIEPDGSSIQVAPYDVTYQAATPWHKFMTNIAGPMNNFILSIVVFMAVAFLNPHGVEIDTNQVGAIGDNSAAQQAGLQTGDTIEAVGDKTVSNWQELVAAISAMPGETTTLSVKRQGEQLTLPVTIASVTDEATNQTVGRLGVGKPYTTDILARLKFGFAETYRQATNVITTVAGIFRGGFNINQFGGPVAIAQITGQVVQAGFITTLVFLGMLSANLGVFNLLPIPGLDGGKLVLNVIEAVRGKPLSQSKEGVITIIGVLILVTFMLAVTWNDISRLFN